MKWSRRDFVHAGCTVLGAMLTPGIVDQAEALFLRGGSSSSSPTGGFTLNGFHPPDFPFKNLMLMSGTDGLPGISTANGYPQNGVLGTTKTVVTVLPSGYAGRYRMSWTGTGAFQFFGSNATVYDGGAIVAGLGGNTGAVTNNFSIIGSMASTPNGYVEFDFSAAVASASNNGGAIRLNLSSTIGNIPSSGVAFVSGIPGTNAQFNFTSSASNQIDLIGSTFVSSSTGTVTIIPSSMNCNFPSGQTFTGFSGLILCRSTAPYAGDLAAVQGGVLSQCFNDDFLTIITALNPVCLRMLDSSGINASTITRNAYMTSVGALSYNSPRYPPSTWAGTGTGTNAFVFGSYPDMPVGLTDGEAFQGTLPATPTAFAILGAASNGGKIQFTLASGDVATMTTGQKVVVDGYNNQTNGNGNGIWTITVDNATHITLTSGIDGAASVFVNAWSSGGTVSTATIASGGRTAKVIANQYGATPGRFNTGLVANANCTFIYDSYQDCWMATGAQGFSLAWPLEVRVALCNKLNKNYWHLFPAMYDDASVTTEVDYIEANLNSNLSAVRWEYSNEVWNTAFPQALWATNRGYALGFPAANNEQPFGWTALKHRIFMGLVAAAWARGSLQRILPTAAVFNGSAGVKKWLYEGFDLNGTNFPLYAAKGFPNYDTSPNRPIDFTENLSYAPYYEGALITQSGLSSGLSTSDKSGLKGAADNYATGTAPNIALAFAFFDGDIRTGTLNGVAGPATLASIATNYYPGFAAAAVAYTPNKGIMCYEQAYQGATPSSTQWDNEFGSGGSTYGNVGGLVYNLMQAYKHSSSFQATVAKQIADQKAGFPSLIPSWYVFGQNTGSTANDPWSLVPTDLYSTPFYTSYNGLAAL
jgi:hypothetical protein